MIDSGQQPLLVANYISLQSAGKLHEIPLLAFVAGWAAMCNDSPDDDIDDSTNASWRMHALPLAVWPAGSDGPVVLASVEMLCRILCDSMDWKLQEDHGFWQRNANAFVADGTNSARMHETIIARWETADRQLRNALLRTMDGRVFAVLVASGNSLD
ncbi:MAG TPA: hypothetical protein VFF81_06450 [Noviherbaspirillum sp.]|nr:hypothetical protein [Noviherbaspirillum sp.]